MRLSSYDEYFTHQIPLPHTVVGSSDPAWRERYWINIQDIASADVMMVCGIGQYPNQNTQEAFVSVVVGDTQRNIRLSRSLLPQIDATGVGPFSVQVVEPLRTLRLLLDENPSGISFDIKWDATIMAGLEERHFEVQHGRVTHDLMRYQQVGRATGRLDTPDGSFAVEPSAWWGERDHSWGIRPIPNRGQGAPPSVPATWKFLMFAPLQFETFGIYLYTYEVAPGQPVHISGRIAPSIESGQSLEERIVAVDHDLVWDTDAPVLTLESGTLRLTTSRGREVEVDIQARPARVYLRGGGYGGWNDWFQGHWKGDDAFEHDQWNLKDVAMLRRYIKHSSDHLVQGRCEGELGFGIIEYMVLPGYPKYVDGRR